MADTPRAACLTRRPRVAGEALSEWRPLEQLLLFAGLHHHVTCLHPPEAGLQCAEKPVRVQEKERGPRLRSASDGGRGRSTCPWLIYKGASFHVSLRGPDPGAVPSD